MIGILVQWYLKPGQYTWYGLMVVSLLTAVSTSLLSIFNRFRLAEVTGIFVFILFFSLGGLLAQHSFIKNNKNWFGNYYDKNSSVLVILQEPLSEKPKSYKALASVKALSSLPGKYLLKGNIIIYFQKDSALPILNYGSQIVFRKPLQEIKNAGNPGGFDYKRYCLFQDISHQVYLKKDDFIVLPIKDESPFRKFLFHTREKALSILRKNIKGEKELGLAEALLIGYKDDLDKPLVQSYSNTGVVHVIAISGLHLGLIYLILITLLKPLNRLKNIRWLNPILIIACLWLFTLLVGGQPSILRSAVMFTCIVAGKSFGRNASIYNTLSLSALILLIINPFWLWDVGFQLSYAAVLSIVVFMKPVYNLLYIKNKTLDFIWKLNAVTIAAQILTTPVSLYHFHQFPFFFLITNFVAVPLSSIVLAGELLLCVIFFIPPLASFIGKILSDLIWFLNTYIERIDSLSFATWDRIQINIPQSILLLLAVTGLSYWLMEKQKIGLKAGANALLFFALLRSYSFYKTETQQKLIVYNVPQHSAIDFISGRNFYFRGDAALLDNDFLRNFHLKPSRVLQRTKMVKSLNCLSFSGDCYQFNSKKILCLDKNFLPENHQPPLSVDVLILEKNPKVYINTLLKAIQPGIIVFDSSNPAWKVNYWKKDCDSLHIPYFDINEKGAFVMNLN